MSITINVEPPRQPALIALMEEGAAYARNLYPPEETFLLDVESLEAPGVRVYVARDASDRALGMAVLVPLGAVTLDAVTPGARDTEVKRMFVHPDGRGRGIATALLARLETDAAASGFARVVLETGTLHFPAQALYARCGYTRIAPFGQYIGSASSVCMAKQLPAINPVP